jgi:hypothetical protein
MSWSSETLLPSSCSIQKRVENIFGRTIARRHAVLTRNEQPSGDDAHPPLGFVLESVTYRASLDLNWAQSMARNLWSSHIIMIEIQDKFPSVPMVTSGNNTLVLVTMDTCWVEPWQQKSRENDLSFTTSTIFSNSGSEHGHCRTLGTPLL